MTVLAFERYPVDPNRIEAFEELVGSVLGAMRSAGGCLWADAARAFDDEPSYVVLGEWRAEADLNAWEASTECAVFLESVDVHLRGDPTRRRFAAGT